MHLCLHKVRMRLAIVPAILLFSLLFELPRVAALDSVPPFGDLVANELKPFAGTWYWTLEERPNVTMLLVLTGDHFTGTMANGSLTEYRDGSPTDAAGEAGRSLVVRSFFAGKELHIVVEDSRNKRSSEFAMTLVAPNRAELKPVGEDGPKNLKPWTGERVSEAASAAANNSGLYKSLERVTPPRLTYAVTPKYVRNHERAPSPGSCVVSFIVDKTGALQDVHISRSLDPAFDQSAINAVKQYKFEPATIQGKSVPLQMSVVVDFKQD